MAKKSSNNIKTIIVSLILAVAAGIFGIEYVEPKVNNDSTTVKSIKFSKTRYTIEKDEVKNIEVVISPQKAKNKTITCKSLNTDIVTAKASNNTCVIKGIKKGTAKVVAYNSNKKKKTTATITVGDKTPKKTKVTSIKFSQESYTIEKEETKNVEVLIYPLAATNKGITCKSNDSKIVTVRASNNTCILKGIGTGSTTIEVISKDGEKKDSAKVTVNKKTTKTNKVTSVKFDKSSYTIEQNEFKNIIVTVYPTNAKNKDITCKSSDNKIVATGAQNNTCIIKGNGIGTATVEVITKDGEKKAEAKITVNKKTTVPNQVSVKSVKFDQTSYTVSKNQTRNIEVTITPSNATDKEIICKSFDTKIATVHTENNTCVVKGIKTGSTKIEVVSSDGEKKATTKIVVK